MPIALVGAGHIGGRYAELLQRASGFELACVVDTDLNRGRALAGEATACFTSLEAANQNCRFDAVVIAVPTALHAAVGIEAAALGKHVVVEKPLDICSQRAEELIAACNHAGVLCAPICQKRFADGWWNLRAALREGHFDPVAMVRASVRWLRDDAYYSASPWRGQWAMEGGGAAMNQGIHMLDMLQWYFGAVGHVEAMTHHSRPVMQTEDAAVAVLRFQSGIVATFEATTSAYPGHEELVEISSVSGCVTIADGQCARFAHRSLRELPQTKWPTPSPGVQGKLVWFERQFANIAAAIRGEEPLVVSPDDAVAAIRVVERIYETSRAADNNSPRA